jgi:hypothetical protein
VRGRRDDDKGTTDERRFILRRQKAVLVLKAPRRCLQMEICLREGKSAGSEEGKVLGGGLGVAGALSRDTEPWFWTSLLSLVACILCSGLLTVEQMY